MRTVRWTKFSALAALWIGVALCGVSPASSNESGADPLWPLPDRKDLSSGYGDFRPGRFHYGLDLRTGAKQLPVVAPVDGYVSQIWISYFGYGKALYLSGDDGRTYVFAHLSGYAPNLQKTAQERQYAQERYFVREWFKRDEFPVRRGDTIAFTGKTGIGAPHLHFETRDSENIPRSPLRQGIKIRDNGGPVFEAVTFEYLDRSSVFENGLRKRKIRAEFAGTDASGVDHYTLEVHPYVSREFGMIAQVRDYPTNKKFSASPYRIKLTILAPLSYDTAHAGTSEKQDGAEVLYEVTLDSLSYSSGNLAMCVYEQGMARSGDKDAYLLFDRDGGGCLSGDDMITAGRFPLFDSTGAPMSRYGVYPVRITAVDASGNVSALNFNFCYGPTGDLYRLTDITAMSALVTPVDPDELSGPLLFGNPEGLELGADGDWTVYRRAKTEKLLNGAYRIKVQDLESRRTQKVLRLRLYGSDGWTKNDLIFSNIPLTDRNDLSLNYQVADGGVYVSVTTAHPTTEPPNARAERSDGSAVEIRLRQVGAQLFRGWMTPEISLIPVTGFSVYHAEMSLSASSRIEGLFLVTPVRERAEAVRVSLKTGTIYIPGNISGPLRTLEIRDYEKAVPQERSILAGPFYLGPNDFLFEDKVTLAIGAVEKPGTDIAICQLNKKGDRWSWYDTKFAIIDGEGVLTTEIGTPGVYAVLQDREAPELTPLRPANGGAVSKNNQGVRVKVSDGLSGIWSDTLFDVRIDGQWVIPEYDAEDYVLTTQPRGSLAPGNHILTIKVTDNAGNTAKREVNFAVKNK